MNSRTKLNSASLNGILLVAGIVGALTSSWTAFAFTAAILTLSAIHSGSIRIQPTKRR